MECLARPRGACPYSCCRSQHEERVLTGIEYDADIVILALDRPDETEAAIASALVQRGVRHRVVVVDQGSAPDALARFERATAAPNAMLVSLGRNLGVAAGRNRGAAIGRGRIIVGLDNDAVFATHDTVAAMVAVLDADPELAAIGLRILIDRTGEDDLLSWGYPRTLLPGSTKVFDSVTFVGAGHAIRREAWEAVGGYDEALFFCWEEMDFCLRAIARGWRVQYRGDIEVRHKVSPARRLDWANGRWFYFVRNRLYIARKQGRSWPALLPRIGAYFVKGLRNGVARETVHAVGAAYAMSPGTCDPPDPACLRAYLARHDRAHRGNAFSRLRSEVLARLPGSG